MLKRSLCAAALLTAICVTGLGATPHYNARARVLHRSSVQFFLPDRAAQPRALILFFGNDVGFWQPHVNLAERLARHGYVVVGLDIRDYLSHLPADRTREKIFADSMSSLITAMRHEFGDSVPFILAGHSFGAEVALWLAQHREPSNLRGVLAMSPRGSGHLFVTARDWTFWEPQGPDAWSTIKAAHDIDARVHIAVIRGASDRYAVHDSAFVAAGGTRLRRYLIPFASHSLRKLLLAGPIIEYAIAQLLRPV